MKKWINDKYPSPQRGITLIELMISLTLGLVVAIAASALLLASKSGYATVDDTAQLQDTGRYAMEVMSRAVRQVAYAEWDKQDAPAVTGPANSPNILGLDSRSLHSATPDIQEPIQKSINGSDVLAIRFFGSGSGEGGDGTVLNCAGFSVPGVDSADAIEDDRGWSIFYVALDNSGEPELRCKYRGKSSWTSESIARGVESFQVLYGIDTDADGLPNQYMNANAVEEMDKTLLLSAPNAAARKIETYQKTNWKKVVAVQVSLLIRGVQKSRSDALSNRYELFGADYDGTSGADSGTTIKEEDIPVKERNRLRKIFLRTIILHKQSPGINA